MKYVYISGPYTNGDQAANVRAAIEAANALLDAGYIPYCPHLSHFHHMLFPHDYETWMQLDLAWLEKCDALVRLDGYSPGADREVEHALALGIPVYYGMEAFMQAQEGVTVRVPFAVIRGGAVDEEEDVSFVPDFAVEEEE